MSRPGVFVAGAFVAFAAMAAPVVAAERTCGTVTAVELTDATSGSVSIEGRRFLVAGAARNVHVPPATELRVGAVACAEGDFRTLANGSVDLTNGSVGLLRDGHRAGDAVAVCGRLHGLDTPSSASNEGLASVADEIWFLSGTPGPNNLSPQATLGSTVCLSGQVAPSQTTRNLLIRWSLVPNTTQTAAPSTAPAPPTIAPVGTAAAAASAQLSALPVSTTPWPIDSTTWILGIAVALIALAALLVSRSARRRRSS